MNFYPYQWWLNLRTDVVCADGSQDVNNGEKPDPPLPLNFVQNLGQPTPLFLTYDNADAHKFYALDFTLSVPYSADDPQ